MSVKRQRLPPHDPTTACPSKADLLASSLGMLGASEPYVHNERHGEVAGLREVLENLVGVSTK
jgi:hypothetical protein